jgi:hypothetical protein
MHDCSVGIRFPTFSIVFFLAMYWFRGNDDRVLHSIAEALINAPGRAEDEWWCQFSTFFFGMATWLKIARWYSATTVIRSSKGPSSEHLQCCDTMVRLPCCADVGCFFAAFKEGDLGCLQRWLAALLSDVWGRIYTCYFTNLYHSFQTEIRSVADLCVGQWVVCCKLKGQKP